MSIAGYIPHPSLEGSDPVDALRLIRSENVGPVTFFHLVKFCGSVARAIEMVPDMAKRGGRKQPIRIASKAEAAKEYAAIRAAGAEIVLYGSASYPKRMLQMNDAPPMLIVKGHAHLLQKDMIGIVGARNASANGLNFARTIAHALGQAGLVTVSGLAKGIDAAAHGASIDSGTVAVIAGGIDTIYPPENAKLYEAIIDMGALVTEMPLGAQPLARSFPARNRIIAGMAKGMVVVEASLKSGTLITAQYALDYKRDLFAVPGSPLDPRAQGVNKLIKEGAILTESAEDVLGHYRRTAHHAPFMEAQADLFAPKPAGLPSDAEMEVVRGSVLEKLSPSPTLVDELARECEKPVQLVLAVLLELELAGRIERHTGARVSLCVGERSVA